MVEKVASERLRTLDGWRGLAVLAVMLYHTAIVAHNPWVYRIGARGYAGVDLFFALSGFLITYRLLNDSTTLQQFYRRRALRLLPALFLYLGCLSLLNHLRWIDVGHWEFRSTLLFARNYFPLYNGQMQGMFTGHFWSLAVEEQFYLLWPPVLVLLLRRNPRHVKWTVLALVTVVCLWRYVDIRHGWLMPWAVDANAKTDTRVDALLWGCLAAAVFPYLQAHLRPMRWLRHAWLPISMTLATLFLLEKTPAPSLWKATLLPALLLSTVLFPDCLIGRLLELRSLCWIGELSYGLYLWQPLLLLPAHNTPLTRFQVFPLNYACIFLFASVSYYFVERPVMRLGRQLEKAGTFMGQVRRRAYPPLSDTAHEVV